MTCTERPFGGKCREPAVAVVREPGYVSLPLCQHHIEEYGMGYFWMHPEVCDELPDSRFVA